MKPDFFVDLREPLVPRLLSARIMPKSIVGSMNSIDGPRRPRPGSQETWLEGLYGLPPRPVGRVPGPLRRDPQAGRGRRRGLSCGDGGLDHGLHPRGPRPESKGRSGRSKNWHRLSRPRLRPDSEALDTARAGLFRRLGRPSGADRPRMPRPVSPRSNRSSPGSIRHDVAHDVPLSPAAGRGRLGRRTMSTGRSSLGREIVPLDFPNMALPRLARL